MTDDSEQERWTDEAVAREIDSLAQHYPTDTLNRRLLEQAVDRLRGGEGERLRRAAREVARMRRSTSNSLAGGMCEALDELSEALGPVVTAEQAEQVHEGHSAAVCPDCGRQEGDLHHPACPLADGDALSPTDGEDVALRECPNCGGNLYFGDKCAKCGRPRNPETIDVSDAAPDTEGREAEADAPVRRYARNLLSKIREECPDLIRRGPDAIHTVENTIPRMAAEVKGLRVDLECYKDADRPPQEDCDALDRLLDHLNVYTTPSGPADERWVEGRLPGDLLARLRAPSPRTREVKSWETTRDAAGVELCASCRMQVGERHQEDCDFAYRSIREPSYEDDAAPDTEGREEHDIGCPHTYGGPHDPDRCGADARSEEAGGEDEGPVVTIRGRNYTDPDDCPHDRIWMDLTGTGTISCRDCGVVLYNRYGPDADRLRGAPEGAGEPEPENVIVKVGSEASAEALLEAGDALIRKATADLRTGREERDLPPPWGEGVKGPGMTEDDLMRMPGIERPEEAGSEDEGYTITTRVNEKGLRPAIVNGLYYWTDLDPHDDERWVVDAIVKAARDRLRRSPEGAGGGELASLMEKAASAIEDPSGFIQTGDPSALAGELQWQADRLRPDVSDAHPDDCRCGHALEDHSITDDRTPPIYACDICDCYDFRDRPEVTGE